MVRLLENPAAVARIDGAPRDDDVSHYLRLECFHLILSRMKLTPEDLEEFREIWKEEFDEEITDDEAQYHGARVLDLFRALARQRKEKK
jgi:hypothetical protein